MKKIILDLCGGTGAWSKPYRDNGYDVEIVTLPYCDVRKYRPPDNVYGILAAPPCTIFSRADWRHPKEKRDFSDGFAIVKSCLEIIWNVQKKGCPLKFWALENPLGYLYNFLGKPSFYFQGWQMGETSTGRTKRYAIWGYFKQPQKLVVRRPENLPPTRTSHKDWYSPAKPSWAMAAWALSKPIAPMASAISFVGFIRAISMA